MISIVDPFDTVTNPEMPNPAVGLAGESKSTPLSTSAPVTSSLFLTPLDVVTIVFNPGTVVIVRV